VHVEDGSGKSFRQRKREALIMIAFIEC
jgi:hypothetical protein